MKDKARSVVPPSQPPRQMKSMSTRLIMRQSNGSLQNLGLSERFAGSYFDRMSPLPHFVSDPVLNDV